MTICLSLQHEARHISRRQQGTKFPLPGILMPCSFCVLQHTQFALHLALVFSAHSKHLLPSSEESAAVSSTTKPGIGIPSAVCPSWHRCFETREEIVCKAKSKSSSIPSLTTAVHSDLRACGSLGLDETAPFFPGRRAGCHLFGCNASQCRSHDHERDASVDQQCCNERLARLRIICQSGHRTGSPVRRGRWHDEQEFGNSWRSGKCA